MTPAARSLALLVVLLVLHWAAPRALVEAATAAERRILLDFKSAITADPDGALASWAPSGDPCADYAGVSCDPATGTLAPSLSWLPALESVSLSDGIPAGYAALAPTLRKLNLSRNALSGEIPGFLGAFPWLRLLDLSYNAFDGEIPPGLFDPCPRLRYVSLPQPKEHIL